MTVVSFRKKVVRRRRRRLMPRKRIFKTKSLYPRRTVYIHKGHFRLFKHRTERQRLFRRFNTYILPTGRSPIGRSSKGRIVKKPPSWSPKKSVSVKKRKPSIGTKKDWSVEKKAWDTTFEGKGFRKLYKPKANLHTKAMQRHKDAFTKYLKSDFKRISEKFVSKDWRGGDRSQYRKYINYGKMKELGPTLIFKITPTRELYAQYNKRRKTTEVADAKTVWRGTKASMQKMLDGLKLYANEIISRYVPKDSGDLRKAMMESINDTKINALSMSVVLDTKGIEYANPVNNMPQSKIRHFGTGKGRRGRLDDPKAVKGWYNFIDMLLNTKAKALITEMILDIAGVWMYNTAPSGWVHPPVATKTMMVESEADHKKRMDSYEAAGSAYKRSKGNLREKVLSVVRRRGKEVPIRSGNMEVTLAKMRERKFKKNNYAKQGNLWKKQTKTVHVYPRSLIKKFFKIEGLNKR